MREGSIKIAKQKNLARLASFRQNISLIHWRVTVVERSFHENLTVFATFHIVQISLCYAVGKKERFHGDGRIEAAEVRIVWSRVRRLGKYGTVMHREGIKGYQFS